MLAQKRGRIVFLLVLSLLLVIFTTYSAPDDDGCCAVPGHPDICTQKIGRAHV